MILELLAPLYGHAVSARRAWYAARPETRRRLGRPVISIGNLVVGGSGKTPMALVLARWLLSEGERPAILSRGYARHPSDGVVVVSDGRSVLEPTRRSGDEPQMLARALPGVPVLVSPDRFVAGRLAERRFGCSVHLLDDGFQHVVLDRDVNLLMLSPDDLDERLLPAGRLREPLAAASAADAVLVTGTDEEVSVVAARTRVKTTFRVVIRYGLPKLVEPFGSTLARSAPARVLAVAGIARPERFFIALRQQGWDVARQLAFRDHHWFDVGDLKLMLWTARHVGAEVIFTTEKDAMRLLELPLAPIPRAFAYLPMTVAVEPAELFYPWLLERLRRART